MKNHGLTPMVSSNSRVPRVRLKPEPSSSTDKSPWFYEGIINTAPNTKPVMTILILTFSNPEKTGITREPKKINDRFEQNSESLSSCLLLNLSDFSFTNRIIA